MNKILTTVTVTGLLCLALVGLLYPKTTTIIPEIGRYRIISHVSKMGVDKTVTIHTHTEDTSTGDVLHTTCSITLNGDTKVSVTRFPMIGLPYHIYENINVINPKSNTESM
jgi:hypothetical protein